MYYSHRLKANNPFDKLQTTTKDYTAVYVY